MRLGLREANQQFSKAIKAVRAGKEVVLTERVVDEGFLKPASRKGPTPTPRWRPVKVKGRPLSQTVIDDREERA